MRAFLITVSLLVPVGVLAGLYLSESIPEQSLPLPALMKPVAGPMSDFEREHGSIIERIAERATVRALEQAARDLNDTAKMQTARRDAERGRPVGAVGVLLGMAITSLVATIIKAVIISIITAIVIAWLKNHLMFALMVVLCPILFVILISWLTASAAVARRLQGLK